MRVFIAIDFSENIKQFLFEKQQEVIKFCDKGNFTSIGNFHLTLRFLGEVKNSELENLKQAIDESVSAFNPFDIIIDNLGQFSKGAKKILWIGTQRSAKLQSLYKGLEDALERYGYAKDEKGYNPHITLGREVVIDDFKSLLDHIEIQPEKVQVKGISLMESTRVNGILTYRPIYEGYFTEFK